MDVKTFSLFIHGTILTTLFILEKRWKMAHTHIINTN